jgi:hypothetical protein
MSLAHDGSTAFKAAAAVPMPPECLTIGSDTCNIALIHYAVS